MKIALRLVRLSFVVAVVTCVVGASSRTAVAQPMARAQTVAVLAPTGDNIAPDLLHAAQDILRDHLQRTGVYSIVAAPLPPPAPPPPGAVAPPPGAPPAPVASPPNSYEPSPVEAARLGSMAGADLAIALRVTHFGNSARLRLTAYASTTAQVVYWDSILINGGPDELDVAIERLVHGMQTGKPVRDSAELETVTSKETMALNRREANKSFGIRLMSLLPNNSADGQFDPVTAGGLCWLYDARSWMADLSGDLGGGSDGRFIIDAAIGAYYPLLRDDFTPYIGGVVRWAYMNLGGKGAGGLVLQPTAGILLGRLSSVQLRGEVGYFFNTFGEQESQPQVTQTGTYAVKHYSSGFVFSIGIGF